VVIIPLWQPQWLHNRYRIRELHQPKGLPGGTDQATLLVRRKPNHASAQAHSPSSTTCCSPEESITVELWELVARERIRDTLARYNWSGDAGRLDDLADTFSADGVLEIRGFEPARGRSEIVAFLGGITANITVSADVKPIVRHNVANVLFTELTRDQAQVSSYFTVVTHIGLDHVGRYRDTLVPDGDSWLIKHRKVSTGWVAPDSAMAPPSR
jgi:SnoaL-like domain